MEAYIFVRECVCDFEDHGIAVSVYATRQEALDEFNEWKREQMDCIDEMREEWVVETEGDWSFDAFEQGYWSRNHVRGFIEQHEIIINDKNLFN